MESILQSVKATFPPLAFLLSAFVHRSYGQQNIIANKDNTRPDVLRQYKSPPAHISSFTARRFNGYNEIQWKATEDQHTARFIAEFSYDGVNFQSAGQVLPAKGAYSLKHYTLDNRPLLYRLKIEDIDGKSSFSGNLLLDGIDVPLVKIYPTVITGNVVNANSGFTVQRIIIVSSDGQQLFAKDMNGVKDFLQIAIPPLNKGLYLITFYGNGWKSTEKFMVG